MGNVMKFKKPHKLLIICEQCGLEIGHGYTYGLLFYCDECIKVVERAKAVQDFDTD